MLKERDLDIVLIVTPDHWHALPMIEAVQGGADVCVPKPISVDVVEGQRTSHTGQEPPWPVPRHSDASNAEPRHASARRVLRCRARTEGDPTTQIRCG